MVGRLELNSQERLESQNTMFSLSYGIIAFDLQTDLLNYVVQEALAHAALIFATLAAAFAFATGFQNSMKNGNRKLSLYVYGAVLSLLFLVAIYAFLRFAFYANLANFLLTQARPPTPSDNLTSYWNAVRYPAENSTRIFLAFSGTHNIGISGFVVSCFLAYLLAFLVTMLAGDFLPRIQPSNLKWVISLVAGYIVYLMVTDYLIADASSTLHRLTLISGSALFVIWSGICRCRWSKKIVPKPKHWAVWWTVFVIITVGLVIVGVINVSLLADDSLFGLLSLLEATAIAYGFLVAYGLHLENSLIQSQLAKLPRDRRARINGARR